MQITTETKKINLSDFEKLFRAQSNELTDQELLSLDFLLHRAWNLRCGGGSVFFGDNAWDKDDLAKSHAGVLKEMGLPRSEFLTARITFNVGVELGQLTVIACAFLFIAYWIHERPWYRSRFVVPASVVVAAIGLYWSVQRVMF